jgi:predicted RNase H-like HicB family nuclease
MTEVIFHVNEAAEGGFTAKAVGHSIHTEADTIEELRQMVKDAVQCHFDEENMPKLVRLIYTKEELFSLAA